MNISKSTLQVLYNVGHVAKGVVYVLIGVFAIAAVIGAANSPNGPRGVIDFLGNSSFGSVLLFLMGAGLLAYSAWQWIRAAADTDDEGTDKEGVVKRIGWGFSGLMYGILAVYAFTSINGGGVDSQRRDMLGQVLENDWGAAAIILLAVILSGVGLYQLYKGLTEKYMEDVHTYNWSHEEQELYKASGKIGHIARAVVYTLIAYFLFQVALSNNPAQFKGISGALSFLEDQTLGAALLAITGAGMLAYGFFMFVQARYRMV